LTKYKNTPACTVNEGHLLAARLQGLLPGPAPTPRSRHSGGSLTSWRSPAMGTRPPSRHTRRRRTPRRLERRQRAPRAPPPPPPRPLRAAPALVVPFTPLPTLPFDQPRDRLSAAARVFVAVSAVSSMATAAGWGAGRNRLLQPSHFQPAEQDLQFFIKSKSPPFRLGNSFCDDKVQAVFPFPQPFQVPISLLLRSPADRGSNAH